MNIVVRKFQDFAGRNTVAVRSSAIKSDELFELLESRYPDNPDNMYHGCTTQYGVCSVLGDPRACPRDEHVSFKV